MERQHIGVIGAGSFGIAIANVLAENNPVCIYSRSDELSCAKRDNTSFKGALIHPNVFPTQSQEHLARTCFLIFPIVPSAGFRGMMKSLAPFLRPDHILIHGAKGLDVDLPQGRLLSETSTLHRRQIKTMTDVIIEESVVRRVGCISGPNLAKELQRGFPSATVVASRFREVVEEGTSALNSSRFRVYHSKDVLGVELGGVLKNIFAVASGMASGLGFEDNTRAMLIARGMSEMIQLGKILGATPQSFLGVAGMGDLVATCNSSLSRNYSVGKRMAEGESLQEILASMSEVAEGVKTIQIATKLALNYKLDLPITTTLHKILFEGITVMDGIRSLMQLSPRADVEFL